MHRQLVLDNTGHTTFDFDPKDPAQVTDAEKRYRGYRFAGYTAAQRTGEGTSKLLHEFDPNVEETLFIPRVVGG